MREGFITNNLPEPFERSVLHLPFVRFRTAEAERPSQGFWRSCDYRLSPDHPVDEIVLSEIVRRVLLVARPDRIILFGSAATGQMTKDSDIDLLVVEPAPANTHDRTVEILDAVGDVGYSVDVIVMRTERFEQTKRFVGGIAYPANKYGRVIYEAA